MRNAFKNIYYIFLPISIGFIIGQIINNSINYTVYQKPLLSPPGVLFPIVWTILYLLLGISYYLLNKNSIIDKKTKIIYYLQLFVNALWSIIFFTLNLKLLAVLWIILLVFLVTLMISKFYEFYKMSAYLNIPYLIWCIYATYLTIGIYILN